MTAREQWVAFLTLIRREVIRILRIWGQTLMPPAITMTLYFLIFGTLIGSRIGTIHGYTYMQYITPGLVMMSVIVNSYGNVTSSFFGAKFGRYVEEMLVSPMPPRVILAGYIGGAMLRGLMVGAIVLGISLFFTSLHMVNIWVTISSVVLTTAIFSLAGFINAMFARKFDDIALVPTFVLTPLTYLGGVFYSIDQLPEPWRAISHANPILYMVSAFRDGMLGIGDIALGPAYAVMLALLLVLGVTAERLLHYGRGLRS